MEYSILFSPPVAKRNATKESNNDQMEDISTESRTFRSFSFTLAAFPVTMVSNIASTEKRANGILTFGIYVTGGDGSIALVNV